MRELNTERIMDDLNGLLGGKGPVKCPVCRGGDFFTVHEPLRVQTAYMSEDIKLVELVYLVCEGCHYVMQFNCQEKWFADYIDPEIAEQADELVGAISEIARGTAEQAAQGFTDEPEREAPGDLESMLAEISQPVKVRKPPKKHKIKAVPDVDPDDHEKAQIREARRRAKFEDSIDDIFEDDNE